MTTLTTLEALVAAIRANPHCGTRRKVCADCLEEMGRPKLAELMRRCGIVGPMKNGYDDGGYGGGGGGDGDGDGGDGDGGDGGYGGYGGGGGDGDGGDGGYGDGGGDGDGGYDDGGYGGYKQLISEGLTMQDGLCIITLPAGYAPYVLIGWAEVNDLFVSMRNCRIIRRFGNRANLSVIAAKGPQRDTVLLEPSALESIGIVNIVRCIPANEKAWKKECPRPEEAMDAAE